MSGSSDRAPIVAVLGTGIMGSGMARSLLREGLTVRVWNRTRERAQILADFGATVADSAAEAVRAADVVVTMLTDGPTVAKAMDAAAAGLCRGQIWLQTSTVGTGAVRSLADIARAHDLEFVDAPVLGTRQPAEQGQLLVLAAGPERVRGRLRPVLDAIGARTLWFDDTGEAGTATRVKIVVNSWVLTLVSGVAEAMSLAEGLGLAPTVFLEVVSGGALDSGYLQAKAAAMLSGDYTANFALRTAAKDSRLVVADAAGAGVRLYLAAAVAERFQQALEQGHGDEDLAATYFASFDR
jgi:3-hydroxyisobutyrate dehydrogenase